MKDFEQITARITKEVKRLEKLLKDIDVNTKKSVHSLIENAAFMSITLEDLQTTINQEGAVSEYQNGENQWGIKKSPEVEIYNTMIKNHMSIIKQLTELMPPSAPKTDKQEPDEFEKIVGRGKNGKG
jgi:hypothetical protein